MKLRDLREGVEKMTAEEIASWIKKNWLRNAVVVDSDHPISEVACFLIYIHGEGFPTVTVEKNPVKVTVNKSASAAENVKKIPPFKIDEWKDGNLAIKNSDVTEFSWLPTELEGGLWLYDCKKLTTFKGISRHLKKVDHIEIGRCNNLKSGLLELAMIDYVCEYTAYCVHLDSRSSDRSFREALMIIDDHLEKHHGKGGNDILTLRKKLINAGLESYL